jgi:hypothetical protein
VVARAARAEHNTATAAHDGQVLTEATKSDLVVIEVDAATHGVDDRLGLLVDFLLHEVVELALHDLGNLHLKRLDRARGRNRGSASLALLATAETVNVQLAVRDVCDVVVFEVQDALGVLDDGGSIRGNEELDRQRDAVVRHECTGLGAQDLGRRREQRRRRCRGH